MGWGGECGYCSASLSTPLGSCGAGLFLSVVGAKAEWGTDNGS